MLDIVLLCLLFIVCYPPSFWREISKGERKIREANKRMEETLASLKLVSGQCENGLGRSQTPPSKRKRLRPGLFTGPTSFL